MKVLILRFSSIGDMVLTTPVLRCVKKQRPDIDLHYCTKRVFADVLAHSPFVDKWHYLDDSLPDLIRQLRAERFDYVIDLHNNLRTRLIKTALGVRCTTVDKLNWRKWLYVRWKLDIMPDRHIVDRYLATVQPLGVENDGLGLDYFIADNERIGPDALPGTHRRGFVAYAIGGRHATKRLPIPRMIELCRNVPGPMVLLGGPEDRLAGEAVAQATGCQHVYNACGLYSVNGSASLVEQAEVVYTHDTGLMHVAAAFGKKVYSIWGNTTPQLGMYPYKTSYTVLENRNLSCRPCSKIGADRCPLGHFRCMNDVDLSVLLPDLIPVYD